MILRQLIVPAYPRPGPSKVTGLTRVVQNAQGQWIPYATWKLQEDQRLAGIQRQQRMPQSENEAYDMSFRAPASQKLTWDFTQ